MGKNKETSTFPGEAKELLCLERHEEVTNKKLPLLWHAYYPKCPKGDSGGIPGTCDVPM